MTRPSTQLPIWLRRGPRTYAGIRPSQAPVAYHRTLPGYAPTPLVEVPAGPGTGRVLVKDESHRFDLGAFKLLGASWACERALEGRTDVVLVTATDGNHGRAVARSARLRGLAARVYMPPSADVVVRRIEAEGATLVHVDGSYDDAVAAAAAYAEKDAAAVLVQDTAWEGYEEIPGWIVEGYETLFVELDRQLEDQLGTAPDLVAVPVGVGSLAQAAVAHYESTRTRLLAVEPDTAACLLRSLEAGGPVRVGTPGTIMNGLNCGTVSSLAWPLLRDGLDAAVAVTDDQTRAAMDELGAAGVGSGPSGAAAYAGLRAVLADDAAREAMGLGETSVVVALSTEGPLS
ncbi:pyridoxal-phosphate dependent enzyme [Nocardioides cheoyonin]|uniref:pyridoxal-phosphate dependent enzyme n=1 Tax=Nocardioides cheoyonin TaxID=3156615 RepID=UPI0032B56F8B